MHWVPVTYSPRPQAALAHALERLILGAERVHFGRWRLKPKRVELTGTRADLVFDYSYEAETVALAFDDVKRVELLQSQGGWAVELFDGCGHTLGFAEYGDARQAQAMVDVLSALTLPARAAM